MAYKGSDENVGWCLRPIYYIVIFQPKDLSPSLLCEGKESVFEQSLSVFKQDAPCQSRIHNTTCEFPSSLSSPRIMETLSLTLRYKYHSYSSLPLRTHVPTPSSPAHSLKHCNPPSLSSHSPTIPLQKEAGQRPSNPILQPRLDSLLIHHLFWLLLFFGFIRWGRRRSCGCWHIGNKVDYLIESSD